MKCIEALIFVLRKDPRFIWAFVYLFQIFLSGTVAFFLAFRLNPRFDPLLKKSLEYIEYVPNFTTYFMRTGFYILFVVDKRFRRGRPEIQFIDCREGLSKLTVFWCYVFYVNGLIVVFGWWLGLGGYLTVRSLLVSP